MVSKAELDDRLSVLLAVIVFTVYSVLHEFKNYTNQTALYKNGVFIKKPQ